LDTAHLTFRELNVLADYFVPALRQVRPIVRPVRPRRHEKILPSWRPSGGGALTGACRNGGSASETVRSMREVRGWHVRLRQQGVVDPDDPGALVESSSKRNRSARRLFRHGTSFITKKSIRKRQPAGMAGFRTAVAAVAARRRSRRDQGQAVRGRLPTR
jgi:hypothetical protein